MGSDWDGIGSSSAPNPVSELYAIIMRESPGGVSSDAGFGLRVRSTSSSSCSWSDERILLLSLSSTPLVWDFDIGNFLAIAGLEVVDLTAVGLDAETEPSDSLDAMRGTLDGRSGLKGGAGRFDDG